MLKVLGSSLTRIMLHGTCVSDAQTSSYRTSREAFARPIQTKRLPGVRGRQKAVTVAGAARFLYVQRVFYLI